MQYIFTIVVALYFARLYSQTKQESLLDKPYVLLCIWNVLFFGLRYRVGIDTLNYMDEYWMIRPIQRMTFKGFFGQHHAPLYLLLETICKSISSDFWVLQIVVTAIFNVILFKFLKKYSTNPFLSFAIYFFVAAPHFNTNIMRESLAIAVFLLNYENLRQRKWVPYYLLALVSIGFHYTALILLFFPLLRGLHFNLRYMWMLIGFAVFCLFVVEFLIPHLPSSVITMEINRKIRRLGFYNINWYIMHFIRYGACPLLLLIFTRWYRTDEYHENLLCIFLLLSIGIFFYEMFFVRFTNYLSIPFFVYVANFVKSPVVNRSYKYYVLVPLLLVNMWYYASRGHYENYYPYHSIFNPERDMKREMRRIRMINESNENVRM